MTRPEPEEQAAQQLKAIIAQFGLAKALELLSAATLYYSAEHATSNQQADQYTDVSSHLNTFSGLVEHVLRPR